jgi:PAS domain S-box-containing protein
MDKTEYKIKSSKTSLRNNILMSFFLVLTLGGITINVIFQNAIQTILSRQGVDIVIIEHVSKYFAIVGSGITMAGVLITLFIAFLLSRNITSPLKKLTDGMLELAQGKWNTRINLKSHDEVGQLAEGFNFMAAHIEDSLRALKEAKEYTDNIIVSIPSILIVLDKNLSILSTNMSFEKLHEQFPELYMQQFINNLQEDIKINLRTRETIKKEFNLVPEGSDVILIFSTVISYIGDEKAEYDSGEGARVLLTITDITERTKMKEMVLQSKQDWEDTFNAIPDMITIHDKDYNIIQANKAAQTNLNLPLLSPGKINKCYKYYHGTENAPADCPSCECLVTAKYATFEVFEPYLEKYVEIRSIPRLNNNNELIGLIHVVRDITQRKQIEEEHNQLLKVITRAKIEWEVTFDSVNEFVLLIDKEFSIKRCNSSFANYTGLPANKLLNKKFHEYFAPCDQTEFQYCQELIKKEEPMERKEIKTKDDHWFYVSQRPLHDKKGKYMHTVIIATDITHLKNTQQQLKQSEQNLKQQLEDLEKFYDMAVGRELKMKELKKEIKKLNTELSQLKENEFVEN